MNYEEAYHSLKSLNSMLLTETVEKRQEDAYLKERVKDLSRVLEEKERLKKTKPQSGSMNSEETYHSLKYLNSMLLIEIAEKRQEVAYLKERVKDLNRVLEEKERVKDLEDDKISCFVKNFFRNLEGDIGDEKFVLSTVCKERDDLKDKLDKHNRAMEELRLKLGESEMRVSEMENLIGLLQKANESHKNLIDSEKIVALELKISALEREESSLSKVCKERDELRGKFNERVFAVSELMQKLGESEKRVSAKEKRMGLFVKESEKRASAMEKSMGLLVKEKELIEKKLIRTKGFVSELMLSVNQIGMQKRALVGEMIVLEDKKNELQSSVDGLNELVNKLRRSEEELLKKVADLEKKCVVGSDKEAIMSTETYMLVKEKLKFEESTVQDDKMKQLDSEVSCSKVPFDQAIKKRDGAQAAPVKIWSETITNVEKGMEEMIKSSKILNDSEKLVSEKKELEKIGNMLVDEVDVIKKSLAITEKEPDDSKAKVKSSEANRSQNLELLKNTSLICSSKADDNISVAQETNFGQGIKQHVIEVEAIKKAFDTDPDVCVEHTGRQDELGVESG